MRMKFTPVTVVDYGIGNLLNVVRALEHCGSSVQIVSCGAELSTLPARLVLPGVGAFGSGMAEMRSRGLDDLVLRFADTGRPFLGICVGAQMLFEVGEEFGDHVGLGLIPGRVRRVAELTPEGREHRIPHIGWSSLVRPDARPSWSDTPLAGLGDGASVYFVHSYAPEPVNASDRLADTYYDGVRICAAVGRGNVWGCQFHPERSANVGLNVVRGFLAL